MLWRVGVRQLQRGAWIWGGVFALTILTSVYAYQSTYGTAAERAQLLRGIGSNSGVRALFGTARDIETVGGFLAWRTLGLLPPIAGVWGLLVATRLLRGEEDSGRWETVLAGPVTRVRAAVAALAAVGAGSLAIFACTAAAAIVTGPVSGHFTLGGALWLALALAIAAPAFAAVGALTAQLAATRREAAALAGAVFAAAFILRVAADGSQSLGWLRWLTPLGAIEEMRPLTGARPVALVPLVAMTAGLIGIALGIARGRDLGASVLARSDDRAPRHLLIRSPAAFALRESLNGLLGWSAAMACCGFAFGFVAKAIADLARTSQGLREHIATTTSANIDIASAKGYIAIVFVFVSVVLSLYAATHATAAREEEAGGRLDRILCEPVGRRRWLWGRAAVAGLCTTAVALSAGVGTWIGAAVKGADISLLDALEAAANTLPVTALFLGIGLLALAAAPRHTGAIAFGAVGLAYLWEQTGAIVKAPEWVLSVSPFHWLALVPSEPADLLAAAIMVALGGLAAAAGIELFRRRDVVTA